MGQGTNEALVVGASGGVGRSVAVALASRGLDVLLHGRSADGLAAAAAACRERGGRVRTWRHEFVDSVSFMESLPEIDPDVLVVAFGPLAEAPLEASAAADWRLMADANLALPGALVSRFGPRMAARGYGRIVLFGATGGDQMRAYREIAAYAAAKAGLGVLAKSAALAWGGRGVSANVLCPGYVDTEYLDDRTRGAARRRMPGGELLSTENMANMVLSVVDAGENGLNGAILSCARGMV